MRCIVIYIFRHFVWQETAVCSLFGNAGSRSVPIFLFIRLCFFLFFFFFFSTPPPPFPPPNFLSKRREKTKKKKDKQTNHKITTRLFSAFHVPLFLLFSISFLKSPGYPVIIFFAVMYIFRDRQEENLSRTRDKITSVILHTKSPFQDELLDDFWGLKWREVLLSSLGFSLVVHRSRRLNWTNRGCDIFQTATQNNFWTL